ncbi:DUF481 domain-containing protein [Hymenobacter psychrophilus]|uniref:Salt-induced outer membrane protein n=1 Tax=Hymenobacter psychrophilus TaxID=651662 RepID=A0A1H3DK37_9BACT|nr:DUF481 domain-containing protein [Hymenobacter psychrophilus]SDX66796.1 Protein of unknown function, DUF481 [Hymenobacter psychrophilus]
MPKRYLLPAALLLFTSPARAQSAQPTDTTLIVYAGQLTGAYSSGGVNRTLLSTTHDITITRGKRFGLPINGRFAYGKQSGLLQERELLLTTTPYYHRGRFRAYALGGFERSNLRGITRRVQLGAGPGWAFYTDSLGRELSVSNLIIREQTNFLDGRTVVTARNSARLKMVYSYKNLTFNSTTLYQPSLEKFSNYRFSNVSSAALKLISNLAVALTYSYTYDSQFSEGKVPENTHITVGFSYSTKR